MTKQSPISLLCLLPILFMTQIAEATVPIQSEADRVRRMTRQPFPYEPESSTADGEKVKKLTGGMLSLITGLREEKDLTLNLVEKKLGLPLNLPKGSEDTDIYLRKLNADWTVKAYAFPYPYKVPRVVLGIGYLKEGYPETIGEVCIDLGRFQQVLTQHGFRQSRSMISALDTIYYVSKDGRIHVATSFDVEKVNGKNHECLTSIDLTISNDEQILDEFKEKP